jgi:hypothetical protein
MSLSDLASIGSFVSGVAVLASLAFLYFQLRQLSEQVKQAERNQSAIIQQGRVARSSDQLFRLADPHLAGVWLKAVTTPESLTDEEAFQFLLILTAMVRAAEDVYFQHELGLLNDQSMQNQLGPLRGIMRTRNAVAVWRTIRPGYDPEFAARIDAMIPDQLDQSEYFAIVNWRNELAKLGPDR